MPAAVTDALPHASWYQSAVTTTRGRGIYAGINYNRDHVCFSDLGNNRLDKLCKTDADCGAFAHCADGGFSPLCSSWTQTAHWKPIVDGEHLDFAIPVTDAQQRGREMAFVLRGSGVTGVFDAGDGKFTLGASDPEKFDITFDRFGLSFKADDAEGGDTITQATVKAPWPALTELPLQELEFCNCGGFSDRGRPPQAPLEATLAYWDQKYYPSTVRFMTEDTDDCNAVEDVTSCGQRVGAKALCVDAVVPLPRLAPQAVAAIEIHPDGTVPAMDIAHQARLEFDRYSYGGVEQAPYTVDVAGCRIPGLGRGPEPEGRLRRAGQQRPFSRMPGGERRRALRLPRRARGTRAAAVRADAARTGAAAAEQVHRGARRGRPRLRRTARQRPVVVHGAEVDVGGDDRPASSRSTTFPPSATSDAGDGEDRDGRGRGTFLAYGWEGDIKLGVVEPASAMILRPEGPTRADA